MTITQITEMLETGEKTSKEKMMLLKRVRADLLEDLHGRQQVLDQVDYMIHELKKQM